LFHNNLYFIIKVVVCKVAFLVLFLRSVIAPPFETFCEAHSLKLSTCILQFCLSHGHSMSFLFTPFFFFFWGRKVHIKLHFVSS